VPDLGRPPLRLALGLAVLVVALVELRSAAQGLRTHARLREGLLRASHGSALAARPRLLSVLERGPESWEAAAAEARAGGAAEFELFDATGRILFARPGVAPVSHWPPAAAEALTAQAVVTAGPVSGPPPRVLHYFLVPAATPLIARLSTAVPELMADLQERRELMIGHGLALALLLVAGWLALLPGGGARASPRPEALRLYEEAMDRLQSRDRERVRVHAAERQRLEQRLQDREAMARAGELTAGIVHEVRNGLGTILAHARLLEQGTPAAAGAGAAIRQECETLEAVVRRFMEFVKEETLRLSRFELRPMLSRVIARESRSRPGAPVRLADGELGRALGDEDLLERAFENLVRNAREAAGPRGTVWVDVERRRGELVISVSDDGPGLPDNGRGDIRPFQSTKSGGLGLGLPIVLKIVLLHRGDLVLFPRPPHGLRAEVRLPEQAPDDVGVTEGSARGTATGGAVDVTR
jgi:signal transduction histidine kinase